MSTKSALFIRIARPYVRQKLGKSFSDVRQSGLTELREILRRGPIILACNHVAWWDPLLLVHIEPFLGCDGYCLMDEKSLRQLPFFKWVGALPLRRSTAALAHGDLHAAVRVLDAPGKLLAIFPQGRQRPAHLPLDFRAGVGALALASQVPVVPVAIRYDYLESPRPVVHLSIGAPLKIDSEAESGKSFTRRVQAAVEDHLKVIDAELLQPSGHFNSLLGRSLQAADKERIPTAGKLLGLVSSEKSS